MAESEVLELRQQLAEARRELEAARRERAILRRLGELVDVTYCIIDADGRVTLQSANVKRLFGYEPEELMAVPAVEALNPDDVQVVAAAYKNALANPGRPIPIAYSLRAKSGEHIPGRGQLIALHDDPDIQGVVVAMQADRERQELEQRLSQLTDQLARAQQEDVVRTLAAGVAHDFNNILQVIIGCANMIGLEQRGETDSARYVDELTNSAFRAKELVSKLLSYAKGAEPGREPIELTRAVREISSLLVSNTPPGVTLDFAVDEPTGVIWGNRTNLHQLVLNLGTNALAAVRSGGTVRIAASEHLQAEERVLTLGRLAPGRYARLVVADTGVGIEPSIIGRVFEPFFTTRDEGLGTGLGLAVVRGVVETTGGALDLHSIVGEGTRFDVYLPLMDGSAIASTRLDVEPSHGDERVAIVDDDPAVRVILVRMLERLGYRVSYFASAAGLLDALDNQSLTYDVVITDLAMPSCDGLKLACIVEQRWPGLPVVLVSGYDTSDPSSLPASVAQVLQKPFGVHEIGQAIRRAVARGAQR